MSGIEPPTCILHRFLSLDIISSRRAEEAQHGSFRKSPTEVHLAKIRLQLERVLHRGQVGKAAHSSQTLIKMKLN
jgi:hypothetical protein